MSEKHDWQNTDYMTICSTISTNTEPEMLLDNSVGLLLADLAFSERKYINTYPSRSPMFVRKMLHVPVFFSRPYPRATWRAWGPLLLGCYWAHWRVLSSGTPPGIP